jgi:tetratricopeptide (TPR) repeat protein
VSANDAKVVVRTPLVVLLLVAAGVVLLLLLAGTLTYRYLIHWGPPVPEVDLEGVDPAVARLVEQARADVLASPREAMAWGRLGLILVVHHYLPQGELCLARAEQLEPDEVRWPYFQALGYLAGGDNEAAVPKLERAVVLDGDAHDAPRMRLAEALLNLARLDEAEKQFRRLLSHNPRHGRALLGVARIASQRGQPRAALRPLAQAGKDPRTRKAACVLLAEVHQRLGNQAEAEAARRQAASLPNDLTWTDPLRDEASAMRTGKVILLRQASKFAREGQHKEALELLEQAVQDYPHAADAWFQLGNVLLQVHDPRAAEQALRKATELAPQGHEYVYTLGNALVAQEKVNDAIACYRRATQIKPDYGPAHCNLGKALADTGHPAEAEAAYRQAIRFTPDLFEAHLGLAALLAERGQHAEAVEQARQAQRLKPGDDKARQLVERLEKGRPGKKSRP